MKNNKITTPLPIFHKQRGIGLPEIMIAAVIGLLLMGALYTSFVSTKRTFQNQTQFSQLQDAERLAMIMLKNVVQAGGYYPNPLTNTPTSVFPALGPFTQAGQFMFGTTGATANGDSISVRYVSASGDGLMNCLGGVNTSGSNTTYVNVFTIDAQQNLVCSINGAAAVQLISGVQNMTIEYGLDTNGDGAVNRYFRANLVPANSWNNVKSVRVSLTFINPLAGPVGQPPTIGPFVQVISVKGST